jgi:site-specific DNA-methyltransferase (adenine-specific)/modification methylase
MCGDSTSAEDVAALLGGEKVALLCADPPYGISVVGKDGQIGGGGVAAPGTYEPVIGDDEPFDPSFLLDIEAGTRVIWGANYFASSLPDQGAWLVWDKARPEGMTFSEAELAWTDAPGVAVKVHRCVWNGMIREGESEKRVHPTQKPIKVIAEVIERFASHGQIVLDPFLGSGTTLIAAAKLGRVCYGLELMPAYCDVIRKRWGDWARSANVDPGPDAL